MARWARETQWLPEIRAAIAASGNVVTVPLVQAVIGVESGFNPNAVRQEVRIKDASHGLMQILYRTAQGVGYTGTPAGLFDPATNIRFGVKFLSDLVRARGGDLLSAISAYNNGNGKRATKPTTVCLARSQTTGDCIQQFTAQPGQFFNQPYVDKVVSALRYFDSGLPDFSDVESGSSSSAGPREGGSGPLLVTLAVVSGALWLATRRR